MFPVTKSGKNLEGKGYVPSVGKNGPALVWTGICSADPSVEQARVWSVRVGVGVGSACVGVALVDVARLVGAGHGEQGLSLSFWRGLDTNHAHL